MLIAHAKREDSVLNLYMESFSLKLQNSQLEISQNTDISNYFLITMNIVWNISYFSLHVSFQTCYLKLVISQSKFSGTRKFTLRYQ